MYRLRCVRCCLRCDLLYNELLLVYVLEASLVRFDLCCCLMLGAEDILSYCMNFGGHLRLLVLDIHHLR